MVLYVRMFLQKYSDYLTNNFLMVHYSAVVTILPIILNGTLLIMITVSMYPTYKIEI